MPVCFVEGPKGLPVESKRRLHEKLGAAIREAYRVADVRTYIREYAPEDACQDGRASGEPVRPLCIVEAPHLRRLDIRRRLLEAINTAMVEAYGRAAIADTEMVFFNDYPLEAIGRADSLQSDQPAAVDTGKLPGAWIPAPPP